MAPPWIDKNKMEEWNGTKMEALDWKGREELFSFQHKPFLFFPLLLFYSLKVWNPHPDFANSLNLDQALSSP